MDKFILQVPKWQGELLFSRELIVFVGVILLLLVGILFCFWGYKYFRTVLFLGIGVLACYGSYLLVEPMTPNLVIRMFLTVSLTFLGMCFAYFLDIIFGYILDRLRIRGALGKRIYLITAPVGAAVIGLTIWFFIYHEVFVAAGIAVCCLVPGLIVQHHKRKKMIRFRCYNDLLRMKRPQFNEDGLEILSMGTAAVLAPVASVLATPEPESVPAAAEPEPVPAVAEPEPIPAVADPEPIPKTEEEPEAFPAEGAAAERTSESEPEPIPAVVERIPEPVFEPEPVFVMDAQRQALSEIESEFAAKTEYGFAPEPVPEKVETELFEAEPAEPKTPAATEAQPPVEVGSAAEARSLHNVDPAPVPVEISDSVRDLLLRKMESDEELLEEAFFVKRISKQMAEKQNAARKKAAKEKEEKDIRIERMAPVYPGRITIAGKDRKSRRKREEGRAKAVAIAAAGLGAFIAGRISKGGD